MESVKAARKLSPAPTLLLTGTSAAFVNQRPSRVAITDPSAPRAITTTSAAPLRTSASAKSAVSPRVLSRLAASVSASCSSILRTKTGRGGSAARASVAPDVSSTSRPPRRASRAASVAGRSWASPGGRLPDSTTIAPAPAALTTARVAASPLVFVQCGPGMTNRYWPPLVRSVTARLSRVSPGPGKGTQAIPPRSSTPASRTPDAPPIATHAPASPPSRWILPLTLVPPSPGSARGSSQRSLGPGRTTSAEVARSSAGFSVTVRIGIISALPTVSLRANQWRCKGRDLAEHELVGRGHITEAVTLGLDEARRGERHVVADERDPLAGDHAEDLAPGRGRSRLVGVELHLPVGAGERPDRVVGRIGGDHQRLAAVLHHEGEVPGRVAEGRNRGDPGGDRAAVGEHRGPLGEGAHVLVEELVRCPGPVVVFDGPRGVARVGEGRRALGRHATDVVGVHVGQHDHVHVAGRVSGRRQRGRDPGRVGAGIEEDQ